MKKLIALIFIITSNYTYAQFSIKNLISMSKLNIENFEIYAIDKGYSFYEYDKHNDTINNFIGKRYVLSMTNNGEYGNERYIALIRYEKYAFGKPSGIDIKVNYQTAYLNELNQIYNELKSLGFNLYTSENDGSYNKYYSRTLKNNLGENIYDYVVIKISKDWLEIIYK